MGRERTNNRQQMKKLLLLLLAVNLAFVGIAQKEQKVIYQESSTRNLEPDHNMVTTPIVADLKVSPSRITYTETEAYKLFPLTAENAKIMENLMPDFKRIALSRAARANDADILVGTVVDIITNNNGFLEITVSGYPAKYVNFRNATKEDLDLARDAASTTRHQDNVDVIRKKETTDVVIKEKK